MNCLILWELVTNYVLSLCAGRKQTYGRKTDNLVIESIDGHFCWAAICYWMWTNSKCSRWNTNTRNCSPLWTLTWYSRLHSTYRQQPWNHDAYWKRHNYSTSCTWSESRTWQSSLCTEIASWLDYYWWNVSRESSNGQMVVRL